MNVATSVSIVDILALQNAIQSPCTIRPCVWSLAPNSILFVAIPAQSVATKTAEGAWSLCTMSNCLVDILRTDSFVGRARTWRTTSVSSGLRRRPFFAATRFSWPAAWSQSTSLAPRSVGTFFNAVIHAEGAVEGAGTETITPSLLQRYIPSALRNVAGTTPPAVTTATKSVTLDRTARLATNHAPSSVRTASVQRNVPNHVLLALQLVNGAAHIRLMSVCFHALSLAA